MENQTSPQNYGQGMQQPLPNATAVLVLGIISIFACFCYGVPGLICGIIAIILANKSRRLYNSNPEAYTVSSLKNVNAGRICAIISIVLSLIFIAIVIAFIGSIGIEGLRDPERIKEMYGQ